MTFSADAMGRDSCDEQGAPINSITNTRLAECMQATGEQPEAGTFKEAKQPVRGKRSYESQIV